MASILPVYPAKNCATNLVWFCRTPGCITTRLWPTLPMDVKEPARKKWSPPPKPLLPITLFAPYPMATKPCSTKKAPTFLKGKNSCSPLPVLLSATRRFSFWTRRPVRSIPVPSYSFKARWVACCKIAPALSLPTACRRLKMPIRFW
ncbi:hypothetical protein SDC9_178597 [bioreactor metagenome]|uniref:Uncharacterized protein n=1 Tax=bioreactor metagenome TaxID=1076179 RepID=A0A645H5L0_9ZZZZ